MNASTPIRDPADLEKFKNYYVREDYNLRNMLLITMGLNTALRISDILKLKWRDVYDEQRSQYLRHIIITEQKTNKISKIFINQNILTVLEKYRSYLNKTEKTITEKYLFIGKAAEPISRVQAYRIIKRAADSCGLSGVISPHSLRKTFGYHAWKSGIEPALLMNIYNHSSFEITKRYLGIEQDDRDEVFKRICI